MNEGQNGGNGFVTGSFGTSGGVGTSGNVGVNGGATGMASNSVNSGFQTPQGGGLKQ